MEYGEAGPYCRDREVSHFCRDIRASKYPESIPKRNQCCGADRIIYSNSMIIRPRGNFDRGSDFTYLISEHPSDTITCNMAPDEELLTEK